MEPASGVRLTLKSNDATGSGSGPANMTSLKNLSRTLITVALVATYPFLAVAQQSTTAAQQEAQQRLEQTIEVMRSQGVPEAQIEEFRKMAQTFVTNAESEEQKEARREARAAQDRAVRRGARSRNVGSEVVVTLGDETYAMRGGVCRTDPESFSIGASAGEEKTAARFRVTRNASLNDQYVTDMRFEVDDSYLSVSPVPWNYDDGVFRFDGDVVVYTLFGATGNRGQTEKTVRMTVMATCEN